jgi:carboxymethylenebutenolidase
VADTSHAAGTPDGDMELYEATPDGPARGGLVVIQEAFGVNEHIRDVTRRAAAAGYHAVAPALFHRAGGGSVDYGDSDGVMKLFDGVTADGILADVDAALAHLRDAGYDDARVGCVGFCFGGWVSFLVAVRRAIGASVGFYGGGIVSEGRFGLPTFVDETASLKTPWLGLFGDDDHGIPVDDVERLREALRAAPVPTEVVRYPEAGHAFHNDVRDAYVPEAAADGWARTLAWLDTHLT